MTKKVLWCDSHYTTKFAKEKAKQLREKGYKISYGSYLKEDGESYCKLYVEKNFDYYMIVFLNDLNYYLSTLKMNHVEALNKERDMIDELAKKHNASVELLHNTETNRYTAKVNNNYILK